MDSGGWDFNAPQYIDFSQPCEDENVDKYFELDYESGEQVCLEDGIDGSLNGTDTGDVFATPQSEVKRVTRSSTRTPLNKASNAVDVPTPEVVASKIQSKDVHTPTDSPRVTRAGKGPTPKTVDVETPTGSPRVTRAGKGLTPNTVEKLVKQNEKPKNLCTNLDEWRKKTTATKQQKSCSEVQKEAGEMDNKPATKRQYRSLDRSESQKKPRTESTERGRAPGRTTGLQRSNTFNTHTTRNQSMDSTTKKAHTRGLSGDRRAGSASSQEKHKTGGMTIPTTPTVMKRKPMNVQPQGTVKNSEQLELEKIAYYRKELAKKRKINEESCRAALAGKGPVGPVQVKHLTRTEEFKFETDSRIKTHAMETRGDGDVKDFASGLRSDTGKQAGPMKSGPTIPEPFKLSSQRKRKLPDLEEKQAEKYESMAQRLANFAKTPDRFRSKPKAGPTNEKRGRSRSPPHGITVPKTPQFETRTRSRPVTAPSREDEERQELEEMHKHQFKAHPMNQRIFKNPSTGIRKVSSKAPTVPEEFHLSHNNRALHRDDKHQEEHYEFHAKPLNKKILDGPVGVKEPKRLPLTAPESPAFALKHRARLPIVEEPTESDKPVLRSRQVPHYGLPFQPQLNHKITEPEPFGFEEREKKRAEVRARKMEQILEEENKNRQFHAQPLPDHEPNLPPKKKMPLTKACPFNLDTDNRGARKVEEWNKKMEDEKQEAKERLRFRARSPTVLEQEPWKPQKENRPATGTENREISEFELNTAKRIVKREAYEMSRKQRQDDLDNIRLQEERAREAEEQAENERLRREAVHHAEPVKHYKGVPIRPSIKPLTAPMSPHFRTDSRLRSRNQDAESFMSA
ncbi:targeting protein for Xklp2-like isoform X2 [Mya arenaria]|uniref:targeting protein for Xklp2-like isoform X2 n=1 Tax=Mya arenaria TaxID=6604 RepID=UPI0022DF8A44|nr:targeting protein for Xklp2-like isoform X2 [Mya arenaria]